MDRELEGQLGKDLEVQAEKVLQNQVEATQIELRNHIKSEEERGILAVEQVKAQTLKTRSDTEFYAATKQADSKYYTNMREAAARAESSALSTEQEAKNIVRIAEAKKEQTKNEAMAKAESSAIVVEQDVKNLVIAAEAKKREIELLGVAYSQIPSGHAQNMQLTLLEIEKRKAMPSNTIWFEGEGDKDVKQGFSVAKGVSLAKLSNI